MRSPRRRRTSSSAPAALEAHLFPGAATVASWIDAALDRETSYKCTAGLHHALRHRDHETGFEHHGFLNVLLATRARSTAGHRRRSRGPRRPLPQRPGRPGPHQRPGRRAALVHVVRLVQRQRAARRPARPGPAGGARMSDDGFGLDHLPYGVFSAAGDAPRVGVRYGDAASTSHALTGVPSSHQPTLNAFMALGPAAWAATRAELVRARRPPTHSPGDPLATPCYLPVRGRRLRRLLRLPRPRLQRRAGSSGPTRTPRCSPTGATCRSATTAAAARSSSAVRRSSGRAGSGRRRPRTLPTYGPSRRLDIEAELGFVIGARLRAGARASASTSSPTTSSASSASTTGRRATSRPGSTSRSGRSSASRSPPRSAPGSRRSRRSTPPGARCPARTRPPALPGLDELGRGPRHRRRGGAERRGRQPAAVPHDVLVPRPDARPPHGQRRLDAPRRPVRLAAPSAGPSPRPAARSSSSAGAAQEPFAGGRTFLEDGDEVTLRYSAPGTGGGRITLGEVTGRIEPARE